MTQQVKYAIAQINIPIEIFPDGEWVNHNDRISVQITRADTLPPITDLENTELLEAIQQIMGNDYEDPPTKISLQADEDAPPPFTIHVREPQYFLTHQELLQRQTRKPAKNATFKQTHTRTHHNKSRRVLPDLFLQKLQL